MIKAAFDEAKINKQAGNCAGLYLLEDDSVEPARRGRRSRVPHQTAGQRRVRGDHAAASSPTGFSWSQQTRKGPCGSSLQQGPVPCRRGILG